MSHFESNDINDDEIRIISSISTFVPDKKSKDDNQPSFSTSDNSANDSRKPSNAEYNLSDDVVISEINDMPVKPKRKIKFVWLAVIIAVVLAVVAALFLLLGPDSAAEGQGEEMTHNMAATSDETVARGIIPEATQHGSESSVAIAHVEVDGQGVMIYTPVNATPRLHVGADILDDNSATMVMQAADVRGDNGGIVGAYVYEGELLSKGQSKSGYCAIIDGQISLGVAQSTPLLEEALESNGYFFRQYPLVVANQIVENRPKGKSLRKALAELDGKIVVIMSEEALTFHEFSQALVDLGVSNAIYLVGSTAYGFARDKDGKKIEFGKRVSSPAPNTNYLVW